MNTESLPGTQSVHFAREKSVSGIRTILKLRALSFVTMRNAPSMWSTLYSTFARRGAITRGAAVGSEVGITRHSELVNPSSPMNTNFPLLLRETPTLFNRSSSWNTFTSLECGCPSTCRHTAFVRRAESAVE